MSNFPCKIAWRDEEGFRWFWSNEARKEWVRHLNRQYPDSETLFWLSDGVWILKTESGHLSDEGPSQSAKKITEDEALEWIHENILAWYDPWPEELKVLADTRRAIKVDPATTVDSPAKLPQKKKGMSVLEANERGMSLLKQFKEEFARKSVTAQAKQIGCHLNTWKQTAISNQLEKRRPKKTPQARSPITRNLSPEELSVLGSGDPDEILEMLAFTEETQKAKAQQAQDARSNRIQPWQHG